MKRIWWIGVTCCSVMVFLACRLLSASPAADKQDYDLGKAEVMDRIILVLIENYYDPSRIDPPKMLRGVTDALQKGVAEFKAHYDDKNNKALIEVASSSMTLDLKELRSPWALSRHIRKILGFLKKHLPKGEYDLRELEYGAANAMLSILDPHSNALSPDIFESLRMETAGEFGGLGIRITTDRRPPCNGNLTVVGVFEGTPAKGAGLLTGDQILRIEGESTVNITTSEAADRLRGKPGTKVRLEVKRQDGSKRTFNIRREMIAIESVTWKVLDGNVGYVSLTAFQENSRDDFGKALRSLRDKGAKGLVIDLRNNPGGLLGVAISIVDNFIDSGTIVTTAGRGREKLDVNNANASGTEPRYPIAILINSGSASAAEIMAGALRNHGRALLIGDTTFGKGSVQTLQPIVGGGALKYTSAQYLTPGDISIQAVGVAPDVSFVPYVVDQKDMDIVPSDARFSEADLEHHLDRPNVRTGDRSESLEGILLVPSSERKADENALERCFLDDENWRSYRGRYEEEFARRLIAGTDATTTEELMVRARELLKKDNKTNEEAIHRSLKKVGVDWSAPPDGSAQKRENGKDKAAPDSMVTATARIVGKVYPGKKFKLKVSVKNASKEPIYRLQGVTQSDNAWLDKRELVFGKINPGGTKSWTTEIELVLGLPARVDPVTVLFRNEGGPLPGSVSVPVAIPEVERPRLAYGWQFDDLGNGNGIAETGEELLVHVTIKNVGGGETVDAEANLSAKPGVDVVQGRFNLGKLGPGEERTGLFRLRVSDQMPKGTAELTLHVEDWIQSRFPTLQTIPILSREIELPVESPSPGPEKATGTITVRSDKPQVMMREGPSEKSRDVVAVPSGACFKVIASHPGFFKVQLEKDRHAWVRLSDTVPGGKPSPRYAQLLINPPEITIQGDRVRRVSTEKVNLKGTVEHPVRVRDLMVFVGDRKVAYLPNKGASSEKKMTFNVEVPLEAGANRVMIVARHNDKVISTIPVFIRRDPS